MITLRASPSISCTTSNFSRRSLSLIMTSTPYIIWAEQGGIEFDTKTGWGQILFGDTGRRSPAEGLLHELGHAQSFMNDRGQHRTDSNTPMGRYSNKEEFDVTNQIENPASKTLRGENHIGRYSHSGRFYKTVSPISTEKAKNETEKLYLYIVYFIGNWMWNFRN